MLIGRKDEIKKLQEYVDSDKAEFIAIYGRRRVGKTFMVTQVFGDKFAFDMTGLINGSTKDELAAFLSAIKSSGWSGKEKSIKTWGAAFEMLQEHLGTKFSPTDKHILFIDELPCLDTAKSGFLPAFDHFWNSWASRRPGLKLIVCGSAASWVVTNLIDSHGGLHNRITRQMHIMPFTLAETEEFLSKQGFRWNRQMVLQTYMVLGGIPYYLGLLEKNESLAQNIDRLFFQDGALSNEYDRLYQSLFRNANSYMKVIRLLARAKGGLTRQQIQTSLKMTDGGKPSKMLQKLVNSEFITCINRRRNGGISENGIYLLTDFFSLFHMSFGTKAISDRQFWSKNVNTPAVNTWMGLSFERICLSHIENIKKSLGLQVISTDCYAWRSAENAAQIDLVVERADGMMNICEIKYSDSPYVLTKSEFGKILNRKAVFLSETGINKGVYLTMISPMGVKKNQYSASIDMTLNLDCLFD